MPAETRNRRVVRHVQAHKRVYGVLTAGVLVGLFGDLILGIIGNIMATVVQPWLGIR